MGRELGERVFESRSVGSRTLGGRSIGGRSLGRGRRTAEPKPIREKAVRVDKRVRKFTRAEDLSVGELVTVNKNEYRVAQVAQTVQLLPAYGGPGSLSLKLDAKVKRKI